MRRFLLPTILLASITILAAMAFAWAQTRGVGVTITNRGPGPIKNVVVHVTGNQHGIGNLAAGESRTVRVLPTSESHVELSFVDSLGIAHRLNAGGYFEQGYVGVVEVELENGEIVRNDHNIEISLY